MAWPGRVVKVEKMAVSPPLKPTNVPTYTLPVSEILSQERTAIAFRQFGSLTRMHTHIVHDQVIHILWPIREPRSHVIGQEGVPNQFGTSVGNYAQAAYDSLGPHPTGT